MLHCSAGRRAYVPSTSESKGSGGRKWVVGKKGGVEGEDKWVKGGERERERQDEERGGQIRLRQSEQIQKGNK